MNFVGFDWGIIGVFFVILLVIGLIVLRQLGKNYKEFFFLGRGMFWWLFGIFMVVIIFLVDIFNLVMDIVCNNGVVGNWVWWVFLFIGMFMVFVYVWLW